MDDRALRLERHLENVYLVARTFAAIEIHEPSAIADTLLSLAGTFLGRDHGVLFLGNEVHLEIATLRGDCSEDTIATAMPLWQRLANDQIAQVVPPSELAAFATLSSEICIHGLVSVALTVRDHVLGLLVLGSGRDEEAFDDADLAFLTAVAGIGGLALSAGNVLLTQAALSRELEDTAAAERRQAEEKGRVIEELDTKLQVIERQHREILTLSAPILDVGPGTLAVPLIGALDAQRADEIMGRLLAEVSSRAARFVLFDMTSVEEIDTAMAAHFVNLISAVGLMGAEGMVTGIRPKVAQVMVEYGVDLGRVRLLPTLRQGIEATRRRQLGSGAPIRK